VALAGATLLAGSGCQSRRPTPDPMSCSPATSSSGLGTPAEKLAGVYRLKLVATEGAKAGHSSEGTLLLQPYEGSLREVTVGGIRDTAASYVHYGRADVDLDAVGAVSPGELGSLDPMRPGVVVIRRKGAITLRLGSAANRRNVARFDGGYMALRVGAAAADRFAGSWMSGIGTQRSGGYFCAVREDGR
jgi:hypothetical protein